MRFAGGPDIEGKGWVPNITQKGLADYSEKDIAYLLETGQTPGRELGWRRHDGGDPQHVAASCRRSRGDGRLS